MGTRGLARDFEERVENMKERNTVKARCSEFGLACRAGFWIAVAFLVFYIGAWIYLGLQPESSFHVSLADTPSGTIGAAYFTGDSTEDEENLTVIEFSRDVLAVDAANAPKSVYLAGHFGRVLLTFMIAVILWLLRKIFLNIERQETPFMKENCRAIFRIGIAVIVYNYIQGSVLPVTAAAMGVGKLSFSIIDLAAVGAGLPFICLSYIFEYGCVLQQEADETL